MENLYEEKNAIVLQYWVYSIKEESGVSLFEDGVSIHKNKSSLDEYLEYIYKDRKNYDVVPDEYERTYSKPIIAFVSDDIMEKVEEHNNIRLTQVEFNNLLAYNKIATNYE